MRILYLDCSYGISEGRLLGALLDAGADPRIIAASLVGIPEPGMLELSRASSHGISGISAGISLPDPPPFRDLEELEVFASRLPVKPWVRQALSTCAQKLKSVQSGEEEMGYTPLVSAASLWTVAAAAVAMDALGVEELYCSTLGLGQGSLPGGEKDLSPVIARLATGMGVHSTGQPGQLASPAAVAFLSAAAVSYGSMPTMKLLAVGCGIGSEKWSVPSVVQVFLGEIESSPEARRVTLLETNIDDMPAQPLDYVMQLLFEEGALDVFFTPIQMKKNRPAIMVSVLCATEKTESCLAILLRETTTLGVRISRADRRCLDRRLLNVETPYGSVPVKAAILEGRVRSVMPEYDVCREVARTHAIPLRQVQDTAAAAAWQQLRASGWKGLGEK